MRVRSSCCLCFVSAYCSLLRLVVSPSLFGVCTSFLPRHPAPSRRGRRDFVADPEKFSENSWRNSTIPKSSDSQIYLFSLQWTPDGRISKPCRDLWKWKDATLGDGRDFFVPKPKTIKALQDLLRLRCGLTQVSVLSNCARLEIICVCDHNPRQDISRVLFAQIQSKRSNAVMDVVMQAMDIPDWIIQSETPFNHPIPESRELSCHWEIKEGALDILHHLCLVAAGMASRPRRPERETIFRPFSSRDAHILLQLKRTKDIAVGNQIHQLLEYTLRAGKAARNADIVPELNLLREFGTGDSKYSSEPPRELQLKVSEAVVQQAINPLVQEFSQTSRMPDEVGPAISTLRAAVEAMATNAGERVWLKKRLHQPTIDLRKGHLSLEDIQSEKQMIELDFNAYKKSVFWTWRILFSPIGNQYLWVMHAWSVAGVNLQCFVIFPLLDTLTWIQQKGFSLISKKRCLLSCCRWSELFPVESRTFNAARGCWCAIPIARTMFSNHAFSPNRLDRRGGAVPWFPSRVFRQGLFRNRSKGRTERGRWCSAPSSYFSLSSREGERRRDWPWRWWNCHAWLLGWNDAF